MSIDNDYLIEIKDVSKIFPGVLALDHVNMNIKRGIVHGIIGENGAGKSTLMNILSGVFSPTSGEIWLNKNKVVFNNRQEAINEGISIVFQELSLFPSLTIAENIFTTNYPTKFGSIQWKKLWEKCKDVLNCNGLSEYDPKALLGSMPIATQQLVEIIKAISQNPKLLILDEPTSSLTKREITILFDNIRRLKEAGITILYISHNLNEISSICDVVSIMRDGKNIMDAPIDQLDENQMITMMVGRKIQDMYGYRKENELDAIKLNDPILSLNKIKRIGEYYDVSFSVKSGEIISLYGLIGAGRTEVCRGIFGAEPISAGEIIYMGKPVTIHYPAKALDLGIVYMTESRKIDGLFLEQTIKENFIANRLDDFAKFGIMRDNCVDPEVDKQIEQYQIACTDSSQVVGTLSGGNQQKLMLAQWVGTKPKVLIIDEPTRGIDVGAKSEIYKTIRKLAAEGIAVIIVSSDLPEVLGMSDRIIIMRQGTIVGEMKGSDATEEIVLAIAAGMSAASSAAESL